MDKVGRFGGREEALGVEAKGADGAHSRVENGQSFGCVSKVVKTGGAILVSGGNKTSTGAKGTAE